MPITEQDATKAAQWWANILRQPPSRDAGDPKLTLLARIIESAPPAFTEAQITAFEQALKQIILDQQPDVIICDYNPSPELKAAATVAQIDIAHAMPWKTVMWLTRRPIQVRHGYGAPIEQL